MRYSEIEKRAKNRVMKNDPDFFKYRYVYYINFDYSKLSYILSRKKNGSRSKITYSETYIMFDTESSKDHFTEYDEDGKAITQENHICAWTISIRAFHDNIVTLRGNKPSEAVHAISLIRNNIGADVVYIFVHNLPWDWMFMRRFLMQEFGEPKKQLNVKSHYPITIQFNNGIIFRDSLILAGVSLARWGDNLNIEHRKAIGSWNYELIRHQNQDYDEEQLHYIEFDTLAGVECLNKLADNLGDTVVSLPFTSTGIVRRRMRKKGRENYAKNIFNKQLITYEEYRILECVYHGGFTHSNRGCVGWIRNNVICYDFKSSYPYCMLVEKMPCESYVHMSKNYSIQDILKQSDNYSFIFKLVMVNPVLKDPLYPMPCLQFSKCVSSINVIKDNGRILSADYIEIYMNEIDLMLIDKIYTYDTAYCVDVMAAYKDYLPKWFRDEVWEIFKEKCQLEYDIKILKKGDVSLYNIKKAQLNSLYGMCVTKAIKDEIKETYHDEGDSISGDYYLGDIDYKKEFDKYNKNRNNILPYVWGVYVTSYAMLHLFQLSECINDVNHHWLYSDTDSIYSDSWDPVKVKGYNAEVKQKLINAGYGSVKIHDHEYWLGVADLDGTYDKFITHGAKRYAVEKDHKIKITVAGVPKQSYVCLRSIEDFKEGFIFYGQGTGKCTHTHIYNDIHIDHNGNEIGDSIDLTPADYTLASVDMITFKDLFMEEITYDFYEDV